MSNVNVSSFFYSLNNLKREGFSCEDVTLSCWRDTDGYYHAGGTSCDQGAQADQSLKEVAALKIKPLMVCRACGEQIKDSDGFTLAEILTDYGFNEVVVACMEFDNVRERREPGEEGALLSSWRAVITSMPKDLVGAPVVIKKLSDYARSLHAAEFDWWREYNQGEGRLVFEGRFLDKLFPPVDNFGGLEALSPGITSMVEECRTNILASPRWALMRMSPPGTSPDMERNLIHFGYERNSGTSFMHVPLFIAEAQRLWGGVREITPLERKLTSTELEVLAGLYIPYDKGPYSSIQTAVEAALEV